MPNCVTVAIPNEIPDQQQQLARSPVDSSLIAYFDQVDGRVEWWFVTHDIVVIYYRDMAT